MKTSSKVSPMVIGLVVGLFVGAAIMCLVTNCFALKTSEQSQTASGWDMYTDADGAFRFAKPEGVNVSCSEAGSCTLSSPTEENDQPVPDMTVSVKNGEVTFRTWENFEIPYFNRLVSSFEFVE